MGHFAGGLAEGISSGSEMAMRMRQLQQDSEYRKDLLDYRQKEQKMKLDALKLAKEREEKEAKWSEQFYRMGSDPNARSAPASLQNEPTTPAPAGIGPPQQPTQTLPPRMSQLNPQQRMMAMAAAAGRGGQMPAFNAMAQQGLIQTPAYQAAQQAAELERKKGILDMLNTQSQIGARERQGDIAEQRLDLDVNRFGLEQKRSARDQRRLEMAARESELVAKQKRQQIFEGQQRQQVIGNLMGRAQGGDQRAGAAAMALMVGEDAKGMDIMHPGLKSKTQTDLVRGALNGNREDWEVLNVLQGLKKGGGLSIHATTDKDGRPTFSVTTGDGQTIPPSMIKEGVDSLATIDSIRTMANRYRELLESDPGAVGFAANMGQLVKNAQAQVAGLTMKGDKAKAYQEQLFDPTTDNRTRAHAVGIMLTAMAVRELLGETGVLTNQDIARAERIFGTSSKFINFGSVPDSLARVDEALSLLDEREKVIRNRHKYLQELAPKQTQGMSVLEAIGVRHGWVEPPSSPQRAGANGRASQSKPAARPTRPKAAPKKAAPAGASTPTVKSKAPTISTRPVEEMTTEELEAELKRLEGGQ